MAKAKPVSATKQSLAASWLENQTDKPSVNTDALYDAPGSVPLDFEILSDKKVILDDAKAAAYIELPIFRGERKVTDEQTQKLYDEMKKGLFNNLTVILSTCEFHGVVYKINGQHTCWAKFFYPGYEPEVREIRYKVNTDEQLKHLYATYDRNLQRSDSHLASIELAMVKELQDIPVSTVKSVALAFKLWIYKERVDRSRLSPHDLASLVSGKYLSTMRAVCHFYRNHVANDKTVNKFMRKQAVVAAMLETFNKVPTLAADFWRPVCDGIGLTAKTDPRWQLRTFLQNVVVDHSTTSKDKRTIPSEAVYNHCVPAFNKWRKGEEVKAIRPTTDRVRAI